MRDRDTTKETLGLAIASARAVTGQAWCKYGQHYCGLSKFKDIKVACCNDCRKFRGRAKR